jgi:NHL repeat-containing protein
MTGRRSVQVSTRASRLSAQSGPRRSTALAVAVFALTAVLGVAVAKAAFMSSVATFGSSGSGAGQLQNPTGMASDQRSGNVYIADSGNNRVEKFDATGNFLAAWGWGVADGQAKSEVCTRNCQSGISGSGPGQLSSPNSIATSNTGKVYVGDSGNQRVEKFDAAGNFLGTIDGSSAPQGHFQGQPQVAVDQAGNLWVSDNATGNVIEFSAGDKFLRQWNDTNGSPGAIAVDSNNNAVYLLDAFGLVDRYSLTGNWNGEVDRPVFFGSNGFSGPSASALGLDPKTGNLYVDHSAFGGPGSDVTVYDRNGIQLDDIALGDTADSQGLTFSSPTGGANKPGQQQLFVSDRTANDVTIYTGQSTPGAPLITHESASPNGKTTATLAAGIVPLGSDTTCTFEYVANAEFLASGFDNATSVPCSPADLGSGFGYRAASANLSGLTLGAYYHYRVVATSSAGTTTGAAQEFQAGPGAWAPHSRCPVDDPAMLNTDGVNFMALCLASNSTHGSIKIGNLPSAPTGNTNLQAGVIIDESDSSSSVVPPPAGALLADPAEIQNTPVGTVTAVTQSAGTPTDFDLFAGIATGQPIITLPIKIHLQNPALGPSCFIGSDQDPIVLHPENTDLSNAISVGGFFTFDPNGVADPSGPLTALQITGAVQGDDTFSVPGATGCGPNGDGSLDALVNAVVGLPAPSGNNHLVLDDASSSIVLPPFGTGNGQALSDYWHTAFG